jgi:hypothetical protein
MNDVLLILAGVIVGVFLEKAATAYWRKRNDRD